MPTATARVLVILGLVLAGCGASSDTTNPEAGPARDILRGDVQRLAVKAEIAAGELRIAAGDCELAKVEVTKEGPSARPQVHFDQKGDIGRLLLRERGKGRLRSASSWKVCLSPEIPTALAVELGAGESVLDVGALDLRVLEVEVGAGELRLDLSKLRRPLHATIEGGVGEIDIDVPRELGVRVDADKGIGELDFDGFRKTDNGWVNEAYRSDDTALVLEIDVGVGSIEVGPGTQKPATP